MDFIGVFGGFVIGSIAVWLVVRFSSSRSTQLVEDRISDLTTRNEQLATDLDEERQKNINLSKTVATLEESNKNLRNQYEENEKLLADRFENLANEILDKKSQKFTDQNAKNLGTLLDPLKDKIEKFEQKVEKSNQESLKWNTALKTQIDSLRDLNQQINKEAENLTKALKGETKTQGNWGEFILESILEKSGLVKDREYMVQSSNTSEDGRRLQPDVIVKLPDDKHVIIDSKVSLVAYERFVNAEEEVEQTSNLSLHVESVKRHVKQLSEKEYQKLAGLDGLDFVLLFIPIEPAFSLALQADTELFTNALDRNIVVVSPTTLMATLRTIAGIWKNEYQSRNAIEIARQSGNLYDKFVGFTADLIKIGRTMDTAKDTYQEAMNKLSSGKGNLVSRVENIKELGAKASKTIDSKLIERAGTFIESNNELNKSDEDNT